jgi:sodium-dependent dicarboxylate transporter 2/3/5
VGPVQAPVRVSGATTIELPNLRSAVLLVGPLAAVLAGWLVAASGMETPAVIAAAITTLTAVWWVFEPIPIPVTSLIPLALFPMFGILPPSAVGEAVGSPLILLLMGGFMLSTAMAKSGAHRRLALNAVRLFGGEGGGGRSLVFGFVAVSAGLSMWISNTATVLMLLPIVGAIVEKTDDAHLRRALLLGIAYAGSVGGIGTPVGTPPNLIFMRVYAQTTGTEVTFLDWMRWALPSVLLLVPIIALWLTRRVQSGQRIEIPAPGPWRAEEIRTLAVFVITAIAWITRSEPAGGWRHWLGVEGANDASVAMLAVVVMCLIPNGRGGRLLDWEHASKIPWGILLLFGSGIAIAKAFDATGISAALGAALAGLRDVPPLLLIAMICLAVTSLTEVTSNTATTALLMPILAAAGVAAGMDPKLLMAPAAMTASCAFMLPVATGPNAVVFSSGRVSIREMAREGFVLNLVAVVVVSLMTWLSLGR